MKKSILLLFFSLTALLVMSFSAGAADASSKAGKVSVTSGVLNVRSSKSTTSKIVTTLKKNSYVTLDSKSGAWWKVEYADGKYGYAHSNYIKSVSSTASTVKISSGYLNVRKGAGSSYDVKSKLTKGETVLVLSDNGSWSKILYHGRKTGYVSSKYLKSAGYSAVTLSVPSFKQTDSRWADVKIGASGKTIGQIGCVTTAIAMLESYRTGKTIYPDAMSKKLSYSSSGNVYWPTDYIAVTSAESYLTGIYNQLSKGKPVLFGAKNSSGSQHWVLITGFSGGSLTASSFSINDPGSNSRTNLQQLLKAYPNFYKYFYY